MIKTTHSIFLLFMIAFVFACSHQSDKQDVSVNSPKSIPWVNDNYILKSKYGTYYENWKMVDSLNYSGLGYYMDSLNIDTLFRQRMNLVRNQKGTTMYFNVKNQNDNKDVEFKLTKEENNIFTFENPFRDYPSVVTYKFMNDTSINVIMFGFKNNEEKKEDFIITKMR